MAGPKPKPARTIAITVLNKFDKAPKRNYAGPILNKLLHQTTEKQRATDLIFGTLRNRSAIDMVITKFADCPTERIPIKIRNIIRISVYELIYSPQTAEYAIVNEAVENAKTLAGKKQVGFVNAVLRQITRHIKNRQIVLSDAEPQETLPQTLSTSCEFDTRILPEPKLLPADYFSNAFSLPKWLVNSWLVEFGQESTQQVCFASNRKPSIYIRPNTLKTTTHQLAEKFRQAEIDCEVSADESMINVKSPHAIDRLPGFTEGVFSIQDITASQAIRVLQPQPTQTILDLCAAPGTKTMQLAEFTGDRAKIVATDIDSNRLEMVRENTHRLGLNSVSIAPYENLEKITAEIGLFDCILLDVPCSNTGVLARRPEVRLRIIPKAISKLTRTQSGLLKTAAAMIKPKGKICYSTCSIQKAENSELVKAFLQKNREFELESEDLTLPSAQHPDHDGGYIAILTKR